jgi:hypothetical protein
MSPWKIRLVWHKLNNFDDEWCFISLLTPCASISWLKCGKETSESLQLPHTLIQINYQSKPLVWHLQRRFDRSGWQRGLDTVRSYILIHTETRDWKRKGRKKYILCSGSCYFAFSDLTIPISRHSISQWPFDFFDRCLCCATTIWIYLSLVKNFLSLRQKISG